MVKKGNADDADLADKKGFDKFREGLIGRKRERG